MQESSMFSSVKEFKETFKRRIVHKYGRSVEESHKFERYVTLGTMIRDYSSVIWKNSKDAVSKNDKRQMIYFSMEFLIGRLMYNNLMNLGIYDTVEKGLKELDIDLKDLLETEADAGLGNGGLGRLAACFMDSLPSLGYAGHGNTIRYKYGFFRQKIVNNKQIEIPDNWLAIDNPWEIRKSKHAVTVKFYGNVVSRQFGNDGRFVFGLENAECVKAVPYDVPMIGYDGKVVNTLRCWQAEPDVEQLPKHKNFGTYLNECEEISRALYPDDSTEAGKILRLKQQYFFVCAGIKAHIKAHMRKYHTIHNINEYTCFQLNDTHPAIAIAEMMRVLLDEYYLEWDKAWNITKSMMAYTNHTILAEALEKWPCNYIQTLLPRIYTIILEIDRRFRIYGKQKGFNDLQVNNMAIVKDGLVHMAHLAIIGSYSVNGVARLHTEILKNQEMKEFYELYPEKFNNKTNGISHRRYLSYANRELTSVINKAIKGDITKDITLLNKINEKLDDVKLQEEFLKVKQTKKEQLKEFIKENNDVEIDTNSIFDVQVKRLHAYKRQLMNCFNIINLYLELKNNKEFKMYPRTFIFGAKAAPAYAFAKNVIELINCMANTINNDNDVNKYLKVVFIENYDVSKSEIIIPAADVSEQISLAGKEASGTGNMKFMMNGAITIGTLDGANVEIAELAGNDNVKIFGLHNDEVLALKQACTYSALNKISTNKTISRIIAALTDGTFHSNVNEFKTIVDELIYKNDEYLVLEDLDSYMKAQQEIETWYQDKHLWAKKCLANIANSYYFSSDRTIEEYVRDIWKLEKII